MVSKSTKKISWRTETFIAKAAAENVRAIVKSPNVNILSSQKDDTKGYGYCPVEISGRWRIETGQESKVVMDWVELLDFGRHPSLPLEKKRGLGRKGVFHPEPNGISGSSGDSSSLEKGKALVFGGDEG